MIIMPENLDADLYNVDAMPDSRIILVLDSDHCISFDRNAVEGFRILANSPNHNQINKIFLRNGRDERNIAVLGVYECPESMDERSPGQYLADESRELNITSLENIHMVRSNINANTWRVYRFIGDDTTPIEFWILQLDEDHAFQLKARLPNRENPRGEPIRQLIASIRRE